jgi:hypothetical protein
MLEDFKERIELLERRIFPTRLGATGRYVTNWNFAVESGFYWSDQNATNRPPHGSWSSAIVYRNDMPGFERVIQDAMQPTTSPDTMAVEWRRVAFPDGAGGWTWGTWQPLPGVRGTTVQRDLYFFPPTTDANRAALANRRIQYFNTTLNRFETFLASIGTTGLTAPGVLAGMGSGWYSLPAEEWASLGGPIAHTSGPGGVYACTWTKGVVSAGATLNPFSTNGGSTLGITIGQTGQYECVSHHRSAGSNGYSTLALNGDRVALESRATGMFDHDHGLGSETYSTSHYIGLLNAGEVVTMGPPAGAGASMQWSSQTLTGTLTVKRIS